MNRKERVAGLIGAVVLVLVASSCYREGVPVPDFQAVEADERTTVFFDFMEPHIRAINGEVLAKRRRLEYLKKKHARGRLGSRDLLWIRELAFRYGEDYSSSRPVTGGELEDLLERVDSIPPSMVLAQAAIETGWGTSRFARQGNNFFGMLCYEPDCGIAPETQLLDTYYELKEYRSPRASLRDYVRNLNTHPAYEDLRWIRSLERAVGLEPDGLTVSLGLSRYSDEGWTYVEKIRRFIQLYDLATYDEEHD